LRGGKYSAFDGGTRVPFIVRWPGRVKPGVSEALISQVDFPATFAALTGQRLGLDSASDSFNVLPALLGDSTTARDHVVEHAGVLSLIQGQWKYIEPGKGPKVLINTATESGQDREGQLYNLQTDLGEKKNLVAEQPEAAAKLSALLKKIREDGRSRP
jgi:arylsulfatase A-like enzyme